MKPNQMSNASLPLPQDYQRRFESEDTLVDKLLSRNLICENGDELRRILRIVGYYRLTGYLFPFRKAGSEEYQEGTTLEKIWNLYSFDRRLRLVAMDVLARIEVALRAQVMAHHSAACHGDPFAYCKAQYMPGLQGSRLESFLDSVDKSIRQAVRANNPAVVHHVKLHGESRVPVWVLMENLTLGDVGWYYKGVSSSVQQAIANEYGISPSSFYGWLDVMRCVRNVCAHQGRLWNRKINFSIRYNFSQRAALDDLNACVEGNRGLPYTTVFTALSLCAWMLRRIRPESRWCQRVKDLLADYPAISRSAMGFPVDWQQMALWR